MDLAILGAARTPFGALGGALKDLTAERLGAIALAAALERANVAGQQLDELLLGSVFGAGRGPNPARSILLEGEHDVFPWTASVRAGGASALEAIARAAPGAGRCSAVVGADSATRAPYLLPEARAGSRLGAGRLLDGALRDAYHGGDEDLPAAAHAALAARALGIDQAALLALRARSVERAFAAPKDELVAAPVPAAKGRDQDVLEDELPGKVERGDGDAGLAAPLADGAVAVVLASPATAKELSRDGAPRVIGVVRVALDRSRAPTAAVSALAALLERIGRKAADLRVVEVDESLAVAPSAARKELEIADDRLNPRGGAQAYGHAPGACGLRALVLLLESLGRAGGGLGAVAYGAGMGTALALAVER